MTDFRRDELDVPDKVLVFGVMTWLLAFGWPLIVVIGGLFLPGFLCSYIIKKVCK